MEIDEKYLARAFKILMRAIARERVENYALRILLIDSASSDASIDIQNKARELAAKRYETLLRLVEDDHIAESDLLHVLSTFEQLMQRGKNDTKM